MQNGAKQHGITDQVRYLRDAYIERNPKSQQVWKRACQSLPGGNTRSVLYHPPFPMTLQSGRECYVTSLDGIEYVDFVSEYTAALFGHSHPAIERAVSKAMRNGINLGGQSQIEVELAEHLVQRFKSIELIRFCNSGTEANTLALQTAINYTKRSKVLAFKQGYHGGTLTFPYDENRMNLPFDFVMGAYNDIENTKKVLTPDLAAILVEPMQGAGGYKPGTKEFMAFLRQTATNMGAVLIFDEVVTSRLHINGMQAYLDVYPDMTTLGKYVGGGFSFGAFGGRRDIMQQLDPRLNRAEGGLAVSGTYNNNVFTMTAGVAASRLVTQEAISRLNSLGDMLRDGFQQLLDSKGVDNIYLTGFGSLVGFHFTGPDADLWREAFFFYLLGQRIYISFRGNFNLNFMHEEEHIKRALTIIDEFFDSTLR